MRGVFFVSSRTVWTCVVVLVVLLLAVGCRQAETLLPTATQAATAAGTPTATSRWSTPTPTATWTPSPTPYWKAEYYENKDLAGDAVLVLDERSINHNWGDGAPAPSLPADFYSVRWTRVKAFDPGRYRFHFKVDDGIRSYVDGELLIDEWHNDWGEAYEVDVDLPSNPELKIEYYEDGGGAKIEFGYEKR
jgi:hypothetical protein